MGNPTHDDKAAEQDPKQTAPDRRPLHRSRSPGAHRPGRRSGRRRVRPRRSAQRDTRARPDGRRRPASAGRRRLTPPPPSP